MVATRTIVLPVEPHCALVETIDEAKNAYRIVSEAAFESGTKSRYALQKLVYAEVRAKTRLTAQMTCSAIRKVAAAYKSAKAGGHKLNEPARFSASAVDLQGGARGRDFRLYPERSVVSISTVDGRKQLSYRCGKFQRSFVESPEWKVQAAKLIYKRRKKGWRYELHVQVVRKTRERKTGGVLGVDTGRRYLAVATTGEDAHLFPAGYLKPKKEHLRRLRGKLKSKGTRSSTRTFIRVSGREARLTRDFQHKTAKELVRIAIESGCSAIAVERLNGIRKRTRTRGKKARHHHATWAYRQFLDILRHKAEGAGLEMIEVDPANTSRACSKCGCVEKANRNGLNFSCEQCSYCLHADLNAARNIRLRAILDRQALVQDGPNSHAAPMPIRKETASCLLQLAVHD
jgi:putative transposase